MSISENIQYIREVIQRAIIQSNQTHQVRLVAVTKTIEIPQIKEALLSGITDIGENRVEEAEQKKQALENYSIDWHGIGHIQSNKAKKAAEVFDYIHSVDSLKIATKLQDAASEINKVLKIFMQVNLSGEFSKHGCTKSELYSLLKEVKFFSHIEIIGLMTIPPKNSDPEQSRVYFKELAQLNQVYGYSELSMGMTNDFEVAIEEGATFVRIGTGIFGERS